MRVLLFEPKFVGHFLGFAAVTARAFAELGCHVTMLLPSKAQGTDQAKIKLVDLPENVDVRFSIDVPKLYQKWTNAKFETDALGIALDDVPTDHLVLPSGDFLLSGLMLKRNLRQRLRRLGGVDLVLHNCQQVYPDLGVKQRCRCLWDRLAVSLARGIRLHTVDPFATSPMAVSQMALFGNPVHPLPHFVDVPADPPSQEAARAALHLPTQGKMLGSIGDLGRRKGTELLIESFVRSQPPSGSHLVLYGLLSGPAKQVLAEHQKMIDQGQIVCHDRFVNDSDFYQFFRAMDAIWAGFPRQVGIASTQLCAAVAGRPVISSNYGGVGWLTNEYGLGRAFPGTITQMSDAISWFQQTDRWRPDPQGLERLLSYHTTENFNYHITAKVRQRLSAPTKNGSLELAEEGAA